MPQMVYIREIHPYSFLVLTTNGESFCLRDFSAKAGPVVEVARQSPGRGTSEIHDRARQSGNHFIDVPERKIDDYSYWHEQTVSMNARFLTPPAPPPPVSPRWQWLRENTEKVVVAVVITVITVLTAAVLAWLGLTDKQ
jgi:hypothetical protein